MNFIDPDGSNTDDPPDLKPVSKEMTPDGLQYNFPEIEVWGWSYKHLTPPTEDQINAIAGCLPVGAGYSTGKTLFSKLFPKASSWLKNAFGKSDEIIKVYHGSINDATKIRQFGFSLNKGTTFVTRDIREANNAISKIRFEVENGLATDIGIIESHIPKPLFDKIMRPLEFEYPGFNNSLKGSSEIRLRTNQSIELFNKYIQTKLP